MNTRAQYKNITLGLLSLGLLCQTQGCHSRACEDRPTEAKIDISLEGISSSTVLSTSVELNMEHPSMKGLIFAVGTRTFDHPEPSFVFEVQGLDIPPSRLWVKATARGLNSEPLGTGQLKEELNANGCNRFVVTVRGQISDAVPLADAGAGGS